MRLFCLTAFSGLFAVIFFAACGGPSADEEESPGELSLYSGRSQALVEPLLREFEKDTGIRVRARFGGTPQLAIALQEEGERTRADLFWAQDASALGSVRNLLMPLPEEVVGEIPLELRHENNRWVATSGRARVFAYSPRRTEGETLPETLEDLTSEQWRGRIGWAPANGSFQSFVTAMRVLQGEEAAKNWLAALAANEPKVYPNNTSLVQAVAAGEVDLVLTNHYYLYRFLERDEDFPVAQSHFAGESPGNLVNYAGVGILASSENREEAKIFVRWLLERRAQEYFVQDVFEYPVVEEIEALPGMLPYEELRELSPRINLEALEDMEGTIRMLRELDIL
ncbi:MAG: iron ABC transporter substrate-binding protein [Opitutales bacterium]|nr:iron ABC transporter substrate-binding protein [Opitutales bacterium]MCH8541542.1 iron ABC transporter substrate-binding protein [Opitutales bacterium]